MNRGWSHKIKVGRLSSIRNFIYGRSKSNDGIYLDDEFEKAELSENEGDISVKAEQLEDLIVAPSDWTVGTIFEQIGKTD